jgi:hypothetical protein
VNAPELVDWERIDINVPGSRVVAHRRGSGVPFYWCHGITSSSSDEVEVPFAPWRGLGAGWEVVLVDARGRQSAGRSRMPQSASRTPSTK